MNSIDSGAIFLPRLGQDLSRNGFVVFAYALYRNPFWRTGRRGGPHFSKKRPLHEASRFLAALSPQERITYDSYSLSSSKSNTAAREIEIKKACQKSWQIAFQNEDISESVNSFDF